MSRVNFGAKPLMYPQPVLIIGTYDENGVPNVYVLPSESFELVDEWQWVSEVPVKPIEVVEISVKDYWHTIIFSDEARDIQRELYGQI